MSLPLDGDPITAQLTPFVRLANVAERVFGDEQAFRTWLHAPSAELGGEKPIDAIAEGKLEAVIAVLERIKLKGV